MKKQLLTVIGLASLPLFSGCVTAERFNAERMAHRATEASLTSADARAREQQARADALDSRLRAQDGTGGDLNATINILNQRLALKQTELDELNKRYAESIARAGTVGALSAPLTSELDAFAKANPDLVSFENGIVKFKSDLTFDLGDAALQPRAKEAIQKFATILNSPAASGYELLVAGHTDSVPVNSPATIAKGHKNNWYLSSHRAISVVDELVKEKVNPQRIGAAGYADQRPSASNATEDGRKANRRVEVLILPSQVRSSAPAAAPAAAPKPANNNKDGGAAAAPAPRAPAAPALPADNK